MSIGRRSAYVLLETVIATGMLLVGMAVIGAQLQDANTAVRKMNFKLRALMLSEMQFAHMDLGLLELDSVDAVQEEDFGPRYKDWAWRLTIEETAIDQMYLLRADVLYARREDYEEEFDFDNAEIMHTVYTVRATPQPLDLITDFGLTDEQATDLTEKLAEVGEGLDASAFDPALLAKMPFEELIEVLPPLLQAFGIPLSEIKKMLPPDLQAELEKLGLLGGEEGSGEKNDGTESQHDGSAEQDSQGDDEGADE